MEIARIEAAIEAMLFSLGDAVHIQKLSDALELDVKTTRRIIDNLRDRYSMEDRGIQILCLEDSYQMCSKPEHYEFIKKITTKAKEMTLSDVLLETLSIIAYKQPITKTHIEEIRGVNSYHAINKLIEYQLVVEVGRLNAPGRPILFGTSQDFLRCFGFESIDKLPYLDENQLNALKQGDVSLEQLSL